MMVLIEQTHPETIVSIQLLMSRFTSLKVSLSVRLPSKFHLCILTIIKTPRKKGEKLNSLAHNQTRNYHKLGIFRQKNKVFHMIFPGFFLCLVYICENIQKCSVRYAHEIIIILLFAQFSF